MRSFVNHDITMTFFILKVGSIQVILDSLDLKKRPYELGSSVTDIGRKLSTIDEQKKQPVSVNGTTHIHEPSNNLRGKMRNSVSYKHYVRQLIPENIKDVEFIYNVNFETGKGKHFIDQKMCKKIPHVLILISSQNGVIFKKVLN